ncbi:MAG: SGNH/GDSL hydrolase family protein [Rhodobacteraceae bacterium]|nr:SGNH/GDSL hydrolase family protein [Paracoccaceae bacterium]
MDLVLRTALAPLLAVQALAVRRHARILPEAAGARSGTLGAGPPLRLLILGDSSAAGVGAPTQDQALAGQLGLLLADRARVTWRLNARTGLTTAGMLKRLPDEDFTCDVAVVALGVNDVTRLVPLELWLARQARLRAHLRSALGARQIIVSGVPPLGLFPLLPQPLRWVLGRQALRLDRHLRRALEAEDDCSHVSMAFPPDPALMAADGFHPSAPVYAAWAARVAACIHIAQPPRPATEIPVGPAPKP